MLGYIPTLQNKPEGGSEVKKHSPRRIVEHEDDLNSLDFDDDFLQEGLERIQGVLPKGRAVSLSKLIELLDAREGNGGNLIN